MDNRLAQYQDQNGKQSFAFNFEPWVQANVDKKLDFIEPEERDLVDDIDLFYPFERVNAYAPILG